MGQAKQRKAEIEQLKSAGNGKKIGIFFAFEPKDVKANEAYPTLAFYLTQNDIRDIKNDTGIRALNRQDLASFTKSFFRDHGTRLADPDFQKSSLAQKCAAAMIAYATSFNSWGLTMSEGDRGCVITVKQWDPQNPNGAKHGNCRFAYATKYDEWLAMVKDTQSSPAKVRAKFEPLFSSDPLTRMMACISKGSSDLNDVNVVVI